MLSHAVVAMHPIYTYLIKRQETLPRDIAMGVLHCSFTADILVAPDRPLSRLLVINKGTRVSQLVSQRWRRIVDLCEDGEYTRLVKFVSLVPAPLTFANSGTNVRIYSPSGST